MALDLKLLPFDDEGDSGCSESVLAVQRSYPLFEEIKSTLPNRKVPSEFNTLLGKEPYGNTQEDPYGDPLKWVYVKELLPFESHPEAQVGNNKAVWAYLKELPLDTKVALYWELFPDQPIALS